MKQTLIGTLILALCLLTSTPARSTAPPGKAGKVTGGKISDHPHWFKESFLDIAEDVDEVAEAGKHVILFMHLNGCPYCYKMTEENFKNAPYTPFIKQHFDVISINIKGDREIAFDANTSVTEKQLAELLKVRYTPTVLFLDSNNKTVLRLNGYRSVAAFEYALKYVQEKAYQHTTLSRYIEQRRPAQRYVFRNHPQLQSITTLQSAADKPLALLFEDASCDACDALHDDHLQNPQILQALANFTFVRLDANSTTPIIDPTGKPTTAKAYAEQLGLSYRPAIVLFDQGREISRIDGLLYSYHFEGMLRYVGERHYKQYPDSFYDYLDVRTAKILESGQDVDLSK